MRKHTKRLAYWPPSEVTKHVKEGTLPEKQTWTLHEIRILGSKDEYLHARKAVDTSQYTSNIETSDEDTNKRRKERKRRINKLGLESSEEDDGIISQSVHPSAPAAPRPECLAAQSTSTVAPRRTKPKEQRLDSLQGMSNEELARLVLKQGAELKLMLQDVKTMVMQLTKMIGKDQPATARDARLPEDVLLPITTQQELLEMEGRLEDDSFQELLTNSLSCVGGTTTKDCVNRIMRRLLTDKVARNYNWKGQKGQKSAFEGLKVKTMICKAVRKNRGCAEASDISIEGAIKEWLLFAAEGDGGRRAREERKKIAAS